MHGGPDNRALVTLTATQDPSRDAFGPVTILCTITTPGTAPVTEPYTGPFTLQPGASVSAYAHDPLGNVSTGITANRQMNRQVEPSGPLPLDTPVQITIVATDSITRAPLDLPLAVQAPDQGPALQGTPRTNRPWQVTFPSSTVYAAGSSSSVSPFGPDRVLSTETFYSHYPTVTIEGGSYGSPTLTLGPIDPALTKHSGFTIPANVPQWLVSALKLHLTEHGGDPLPEELPGVDQHEWQQFQAALRQTVPQPASGVTRLGAAELPTRAGG